MAVAQPTGSSPLNNPDHAKLHRVIAADPEANDESIVIDGNEKISFLQDLYSFPQSAGISGQVPTIAGASGAMTFRNLARFEIGTFSRDMALTGAFVVSMSGLWKADAVQMYAAGPQGASWGFENSGGQSVSLSYGPRTATATVFRDGSNIIRINTQTGSIYLLNVVFTTADFTFSVGKIGSPSGTVTVNFFATSFGGD